MKKDSTHRDCLTSYSEYWGKMVCFDHDTPYGKPIRKPARITKLFTGKKK